MPLKRQAQMISRQRIADAFAAIDTPGSARPVRIRPWPERLRLLKDPKRLLRGIRRRLRRKS
jgi:hypothetical protein